MGSRAKAANDDPHGRPSVLVIGGAGYLGSHIAKALNHAGFLPVALDDLSSGSADRVRWGPFLQADCADTDAVESALAEYRAAVVVYCAGRRPPEDVAHAEDYLRDGERCVESVLTAMRRRPAQALVCLSTHEVYGRAASGSTREAAQLLPVSAWGELCARTERSLRLLGMQTGQAHLVLRLAEVAGSDTDAGLCEPLDDWHVVARLAHSAARLLDGTAPDGFPHVSADGTAVRDYVNIVDVQYAVVRSVLYLLCGGRNAVVNIGSGRGASEIQMAQALRHVAGLEFPVRMIDRRLQPLVSVADISLARDLLYWSAQNSEPHQIAKAAWESAMNKRMIANQARVL